MAKLVVLYKMPKDPEAFNSYYAATHIPIARKIPGLRGYDVSRGVVATPAGPSEVHLLAASSRRAVSRCSSSKKPRCDRQT